MTRYTVAWGVDDANPSGQHTIAVSTVDEAYAVLDDIAAKAAADQIPRLVDVYQGQWSEGEPVTGNSMQLVWGHPQRASLTWLGPDAGFAVDRSLPEWPEAIGYDFDEISPRRTRLTPADVRSAVAEFVLTGQRPACVSWER